MRDKELGILKTIASKEARAHVAGEKRLRLGAFKHGFIRLRPGVNSPAHHPISYNSSCIRCVLEGEKRGVRNIA